MITRERLLELVKEKMIEYSDCPVRIVAEKIANKELPQSIKNCIIDVESKHHDGA